MLYVFFFFQAEDGIRDGRVTGVQTCALPILAPGFGSDARPRPPAGRSRSAVRSASTGQGDERALLARAAAGVPASAQSATDALDELVFCGHYGRRSPGRDQAVRREPEARLMLIGRRYRLKLDFGQAAYAERTAGICRAVWNAALDQRRAAAQLNCGRTEARAVWPSFASQCRELAQAKRTEPWLGEAPSHCLQQTLRDRDKACRQHGVWRVRWRGKRRWEPSFRFPDATQIGEARRLG